MFDLEKSVNLWRESLPDQLRGREAMVEELEQHLRDDFDRRVALGAAEMEAWTAAIDSLGSSKELAHEFEKIDGGVWLPAWIAFGALVVVAGLLLVVGIKMRQRPLLAAHVIAIVTGYGAVLGIGLLATIAIIARAIVGWNPAKQEVFRVACRRVAMVACVTTLIGVVLGAVWAHIHLGRWWAWDDKEIGGACVLAWSFVLVKTFAVGDAEVAEEAPMLLGVIGNIVVGLAWFGPIIFNQRQSYGGRPMIWGASLGGFLIAQIGLVYLTLLGARIGRRLGIGPVA